MSTYANVKIGGRDFHVKSDGWDKETIKDCVKEYVQQARKYTKTGWFDVTVVDAIASESASDYYAPFGLGLIDLAEYMWSIEIGPRGGVTIRGGRVKREGGVNGKDL